MDFPFTHNIAKLGDLVRASGDYNDSLLDDASELTHYAVQLRYPPFQDDVTYAEYEDALRAAEAVVAWAELIIANS